MGIHKTAVVDAKADIAGDVEIGPFSVIGPQVTIGQGTCIHPNVVVTGKVSIGRSNTVHAGSVIGGDPQDLKYKGEDSAVEIGDNNTIREYVTVNKGTEFGGWVTSIGNDNLIMAYVHIAHDCIVGDNVILANATTMGGHVTVESNAVISGLVGIHHFVTIGERAFVGGASKVVTDLPPFMMADGHPLKVRNINQVGLERAGYSRDVVSKLRKIYQLVYKERENVSALSGEIQPGHELFCKEVQQVFEFMHRAEQGRYGRAKESERSDL